MIDFILEALWLNLDVVLVLVFVLAALWIMCEGV